MAKRGTPEVLTIVCSTIGRTLRSCPAEWSRRLKKSALNNATVRRGCTLNSKCRRRMRIRKSCRNIGSRSMAKVTRNTSGTPKCRCFHVPETKCFTVRSIMHRRRKKSCHLPWARRWMRTFTASTILSSTSLIGRRKLFGSRSIRKFCNRNRLPKTLIARSSKTPRRRTISASSNFRSTRSFGWVF